MTGQMRFRKQRESSDAAGARKLMPDRIGKRMQVGFHDDTREDTLQSFDVAESIPVAAMSFHNPLAPAPVLAHSYCCVPHSGQNLAFFGMGLPQLKQNFVSVAGASAGVPAAVGGAGGGGALGFCGAGPPGSGGRIAFIIC